jgi:hypothetical protein
MFCVRVVQVGPNFASFVTARTAAGKIFYIINRVPKIDSTGSSGTHLAHDSVRLAGLGQEAVNGWRGARASSLPCARHHHPPHSGILFDTVLSPVPCPRSCVARLSSRTLRSRTLVAPRRSSFTTSP